MSTIETSPQEIAFSDPRQFTDAHFFGASTMPVLLVGGARSAGEIAQGEIVDGSTYDEYSAVTVENDTAVDDAEASIERATKTVPLLLDQFESDQRRLAELNGLMAANYDEKLRIEAMDRDLVGEMISATARKGELEVQIAQQEKLLEDTEEEMEPEEARFQRCQKDVDDGNALGTENMTPDERSSYMQSWDTLNTPNDFLHNHTRLTNEIAALKALLGQLKDIELHGINASMQSNSATHKQNALKLAELDTEMQDLMFQCRGVRERVKTVERILSNLASAVQREFGEGMMRVGTELERSDDATIS